MKDHDQWPRWNTRLLYHWWPDDIVERICSIPLGGQDIPYWKNEKAGSCTTKALYKHLRNLHTGPNFPWHIIWSLEIPSKQKVFLWKCLQDRIPTRIRLHRIFPDINPSYVFCLQEYESRDHLFSSCEATRRLRQNIQDRICLLYTSPSPRD